MVFAKIAHASFAFFVEASISTYRQSTNSKLLVYRSWEGWHHRYLLWFKAKINQRTHLTVRKEICALCSMQRMSVWPGENSLISSIGGTLGKYFLCYSCHVELFVKLVFHDYGRIKAKAKCWINCKSIMWTDLSTVLLVFIISISWMPL